MKRVLRHELADALKSAYYVIYYGSDTTGLTKHVEETLERAYKEGLVPRPATKDGKMAKKTTKDTNVRKSAFGKKSPATVRAVKKKDSIKIVKKSPIDRAVDGTVKNIGIVAMYFKPSLNRIEFWERIREACTERITQLHHERMMAEAGGQMDGEEAILSTI